MLKPQLPNLRRYAKSFLALSIVLVVVNSLNFSRQVTCWDCFFPYGLPFTFYQDGGYGGGAGIVWKGLLADCGILIVASAFVGWIWTTVARIYRSGENRGNR